MRKGSIYDFHFDEIQKQPGKAESNIRLKCGRTIRINVKKMTRAQFKRSCLIPLFDRVPATLANPVFRVMQNHFPSIAEYVIRAKHVRHQDLACLCQRAEAELMIDGVGAVLMSEHEGEPVQPIHDALLVRKAFGPTAREIICDQFSRFGLRPRVKRVRLGFGRGKES